MENVLTQLNLYCGDILGEKSKAIKDEKKIKRKSITTNSLNINNDVTDRFPKSDVGPRPILECRSLSKVQSKKNESSPSICAVTGDVFNTDNERYTEDGFKITCDIPSDDSDISDAFTSDGEDYESGIALSEDNKNSRIKKQKNKCINDRYTEDGFKITSGIPPDDSDISDAFDSDGDNGDGKGVGDCQLTKKKRNEKLKTLKKPLLQLISDFGMENELFSKKKTLSGMPRDHLSQNLNIIDYSKKRGKSKMENLNSAKNDDKTKNIEEKEQFKKARYDVFKFGITGFETQEKKNLKIALAIKLGAKPPKKVAKNYKTIIEEKMIEKKLELDRLERKDDPLNKIKAKTIAKKKDTASLHGITTGKFQGGVLKLSKSDIKKIQSSR